VPNIRQFWWTRDLDIQKQLAMYPVSWITRNTNHPPAAKCRHQLHIASHFTVNVWRRYSAFFCIVIAPSINSRMLFLLTFLLSLRAATCSVTYPSMNLGWQSIQLFLEASECDFIKTSGCCITFLFSTLYDIQVLLESEIVHVKE